MFYEMKHSSRIWTLVPVSTYDGNHYTTHTNTHTHTHTHIYIYIYIYIYRYTLLCWRVIFFMDVLSNFSFNLFLWLRDSICLLLSAFNIAQIIFHFLDNISKLFFLFSFKRISFDFFLLIFFVSRSFQDKESGDSIFVLTFCIGLWFTYTNVFSFAEKKRNLRKIFFLKYLFSHHQETVILSPSFYLSLSLSLSLSLTSRTLSLSLFLYMYI